MFFSPLPIFFTARLSGYSFCFCVEAIVCLMTSLPRITAIKME